MAKSVNSKTINLHYKKSTKGTHVYKQDENEGRHVFYLERSLFNGEPPQDVTIVVGWK